jgi:hypothetical protein
LHNYASTYDSKLPALTTTTTTPNYGNYNGSILVTLLPFIEQQALYTAAISNPANSWDTVVPGGTTAVRQTMVKAYQCPSDPTISNGWAANAVNSWMAASYGPNLQVFGKVRGGGKTDAPQYGIGNIPDGTSNTVAFAEVFAACGSGYSAWAWPGIDWGASQMPVVANSRSYTTTGGGAGAWDAPPQSGATQATCVKSQAQSPHSGVCLVGLCDGSVRTVSTSITWQTWHNALQADDGQPLGSNW